MMTWAIWANLIWLAANLVGVILLFRYGMPYRVPSRGKRPRGTMPTAESIEEERYHEFWGRVGLALIVGGTVAQMVAPFLPLPAP